jgi:hypothetical protein
LALTGIPLLLLCWAGTKLVFGLTIVAWRHGGRVRVLTRTVSILLCEAMVLFTVGVAANRALDLYPSWAALLHPVPRPKPVAAPAARLDGWLHSRDVRGGPHGVTFAWEPPGWTGWGLREAPSVFVPQSYFTGSARHFPVVVLVAPAQTGPAGAAWGDRHVLQTMAGSTAAVVILLRINRTTPAGADGVGGTVTDRLPYALNRDVRVSPHGWAILGIGTDAPLALTALAQRPERYQDAALVTQSAAPPPPPVLAQLRHGFPEQPLCLVGAATGGRLPPQLRVLLVPAPPARLAAALRWVYPLLPAPLATPETGPIGIPPKPRPRTQLAPGGTPPPPGATPPPPGATPPRPAARQQLL